MAENKKPGFFSRLFGRKPAPAEPASVPVDESKVLQPAVPDTVPAVEVAPPVEAPKVDAPDTGPKGSKRPARSRKQDKAAGGPQSAPKPKPVPKTKSSAVATPETAVVPERAVKPAPKPGLAVKAKPAPKPKPAPKKTKVTPKPAPTGPFDENIAPVVRGTPVPDEASSEDLRAMEPGPPESTTEWVDEAHPAAAEPDAVPKRNWLQRLAGGLKRSSDSLTQGLNSVFVKRKLDEDTLQELEDILLTADIGIETTEAILAALRRDKFDREVTTDEVRRVLSAEVAKVLAPVAQPLHIDDSHKPFVVLMVGVNGTGKTTTIGKLAHKLSDQGKSVMMAAGDTFRAAAIEQLQIWGERSGVPVIARPAGSDASGLAFDALTEARAAGSDVLIIDTAGRLQNRDELMAELEKIIRVIRKVDASAPHAVLLTLDATTGQNALVQADIFQKRAGVTGLVMTKLDGTARGGILVAIARRFGLPVHFIGVGEGIEDFEPFEAEDFARAIAGKAD